MGSDRDLHFFASLVPKLNFQRDKTRFHLVKKKNTHSKFTIYRSNNGK